MVMDINCGRTRRGVGVTSIWRENNPLRVGCFRSGDGFPGGGGVPGSKFNKMTLDDLFAKIDLRGKPVLVRVDFNVSDPKTGKIKSDARIKAALQTILELKEKGAKVVIISHNDDPHKLVKSFETAADPLGEAMKKLTLEPVACRLKNLLKEKNGKLNVLFVPFISGGYVEAAAAEMGKNDILVLENTRMDKRDTAAPPKGKENDEAEIAKAKMLREQFAEDIINSVKPVALVQEGFAVFHRINGSTTGVAAVIKRKGGVVVAGRLVEQEIRIFGEKILQSPQYPFVFFSGGSKVQSKVEILINLVTKVNKLVIGGAMVWAFFKALGYKGIGEHPLKLSAVDTEKEIEMAKKVLAAKDAKQKVILPGQLVVFNGTNFKDIDLKNGETVPEGYTIADISPNEVKKIASGLGKIGTVVWNGDFGYTNVMVEGNPDLSRKFQEKFMQGTLAVIDYLSKVYDDGGVVAAGGGDSEKSVKEHAKERGLEKPKLTLLSTGGGAMLDLLANGTLPGIEAIDNKS
jgi:3-phosphoglycerate kinase